MKQIIVIESLIKRTNLNWYQVQPEIRTIGIGGIFQLLLPPPDRDTFSFYTGISRKFSS